jgi:hypothetical protein
MLRRWIPGIAALLLTLGAASTANAQNFNNNRYYYYPYYYFPHSYWPSMSPTWPEPPGTPYRPAPAYMALPPYREPHWRYEWWQAQSWYRGSHFWLDQF